MKQQGVFYGAIDHGTIVELVIGGRRLFGDHRPTWDSLAAAELRIGDTISYEADGDRMVGFSVVKRRSVN